MLFALNVALYMQTVEDYGSVAMGASVGLISSARILKGEKFQSFIIVRSAYVDCDSLYIP